MNHASLLYLRIPLYQAVNVGKERFDEASVLKNYILNSREVLYKKSYTRNQFLIAHVCKDFSSFLRTI